MEKPGEFTTKQHNGKKGFSIMFICNKRGARITAYSEASLMKKSKTLLKL
jgi:phosphopantothenoylcysteine synthetase/decarboxylase